MMSASNINPLAASNSRRMWHCPPHFTKIEVDVHAVDLVSSVTVNTYRERNVRWWLYENIEGRFFLGNTTIESGRMLKDRFVVAFENAAEATFFSLIKNQVMDNDPTV